MRYFHASDTVSGDMPFAKGKDDGKMKKLTMAVPVAAAGILNAQSGVHENECGLCMGDMVVNSSRCGRSCRLHTRLMKIFESVKRHIVCAAIAFTVLLGMADTEIVDGITWNYTVKDGFASVGYQDIPASTLGAITIPSTLGGYPVTSIGVRAFYCCSGLTSVTIPDSVTSIGKEAFYGCDGLADDDGLVIVRGVLYGYFGTKSDVMIPDSVTDIGDRAFQYCSGLTSVTIPDSVTSIGNSAFEGCGGLTSVTIGNSVTSIGDRAFRYCDGLTSIAIGNSVTSIGNSAFSGCSGLKSITIPDSVTSIGEGAFANCGGLTSITIPGSVTSIGKEAFYNCYRLANADGFVIVRDVLYFYYVTKIDVTIPDSVTSIGDSAFYRQGGLTSVTIPDSVTNIGDRAFCECFNLKSITIGNSVARIGDYAFYYCNFVTSITIPDSVTSIGERAFDCCWNLTSVTFRGDAPSVGGSAFSPVDASFTVRIPRGNETYNVVDDKWQGMSAVYYGPDVGGKGSVAVCDGGYAVKAKDGETLSVDDFSFDVAREAYKIDIAADGKSATVKLKEPVFGGAAASGVEEEDESDPSGALVEVAKENISAAPTDDEEKLGALPVKAYPGLFYQAAWGDDLASMTGGEKVKSDGGTLYLGVIKQNGDKGFYKVSVSEE